MQIAHGKNPSADDVISPRPNFVGCHSRSIPTGLNTYVVLNLELVRHPVLKGKCRSAVQKKDILPVISKSLLRSVRVKKRGR